MARRFSPEVCKYLVWHPNDRFESRAKEGPPRIANPRSGLWLRTFFALYAFDLLIIIYEEAWADLDAPESQATGRRLRDGYPELVALREAIPGLVLRNNNSKASTSIRDVRKSHSWLCGCVPNGLFRYSASSNVRLSPRQTLSSLSPCQVTYSSSKEFIGSLDDNLTRLMSRVFDTMLLAGEARVTAQD